VTGASPPSWNQSDADAIREQLSRVLRSAAFQASQRRRRFLEFIVDETLAGRGDRLKGYAIAVEVFERPETFDPAVDPIVRIEAGRLRDKLREYYDSDGRNDRVRIDLPKGSYVPQILFRAASTGDAPTPEAEVAGDKPATRRDEGRAWSARHAISLGAAAAALLLIVGLWTWGHREPTAGVSPKPSIAVLPFENIGRDARWDRLADGLGEDIITDLSHARDLAVIARNSTQPYKNKPVDVRLVGHDLGVKYVLEGSIQPIGDRIRVTAQLIETATGSHVWSERYDRPATDLFAVQTEVTQRIAATLISYQGAVAQAERGVLRRKRPTNLTAYETYLLAIEAKHRVDKDSLLEAERLFHKAIAIDPQFARAYCGLATVQYYLIDQGWVPSVADAVRKMADAAATAVALDPNDGLTHQVLGMAYGYQGKPEQSLAEFDRAEALAPSDADLLLIVAWSLPTLGQPDRAVTLAERAVSLNPHYPDWYNQGLSFVYFFAGRYDTSARYRLLVKNPSAIDYAFLAMAYGSLDRPDDAALAAANVRKLNPVWNAESYLSDAGGYPDDAATLFVDAARRVGLSDCVAADKLRDAPGLVRTKACDQRRPATAG